MTSPQLIDISNSLLIHPLSWHCPDSVDHLIKVWDVMEPQFVCYEDIRHLATKQLEYCVWTVLYYWNLSWFPVFNFMKIVKYTYAKNNQNREKLDKDIAKIKQCSFCLTWAAGTGVATDDELQCLTDVYSDTCRQLPLHLRWCGSDVWLTVRDEVTLWVQLSGVHVLPVAAAAVFTWRTLT